MSILDNGPILGDSGGTLTGAASVFDPQQFQMPSLIDPVIGDNIGRLQAGGTITSKGELPGPANDTVNASTTISDMLLSSRSLAAILGILCIGSGLLMFKTTQTIITTTGKAAVKGAALVA